MIKANYTVVLAELLEAGFDIGLKEYPIWNEEHRAELNQKIIDHYYFREIGAETPERFKFYLNRTMREIMPYYNKLYETMSYEYNPIHNVDYTEEYTISRDRDRTDNSESSGTVSGTSNYSSENSTSGNSTSSVDTETNDKQRVVEVDTPQGVVGLDGFGEEVNYASKINFNKDDNNSSSTSEDTNSSTSSGSADSESSSTSEITGKNTSVMNEEETYQRHLKGNYGVKSSQQMIREERDLIVNIDMMIVHDLNDCFMNIY